MIANQDTFTLFLCSVETDHVGRTLPQILDFSFDELENTHDYIQWLFPLNSQSPIVPEAPVLTSLDGQRFKRYPRLQSAYREGFYKMFSFYQHTDHWLRLGDHNHKRISRIIGSASLLDLGADVAEFRKMLDERNRMSGNPISSTLSSAHRYWKDMAAFKPIVSVPLPLARQLRSS